MHNFSFRFASIGFILHLGLFSFLIMIEKPKTWEELRGNIAEILGTKDRTEIKTFDDRFGTLPEQEKKDFCFAMNMNEAGDDLITEEQVEENRRLQNEFYMEQDDPYSSVIQESQDAIDRAEDEDCQRHQE